MFLSYHFAHLCLATRPRKTMENPRISWATCRGTCARRAWNAEVGSAWPKLTSISPASHQHLTSISPWHAVYAVIKPRLQAIWLGSPDQLCLHSVHSLQQIILNSWHWHSMTRQGKCQPQLFTATHSYSNLKALKGHTAHVDEIVLRLSQSRCLDCQGSDLPSLMSSMLKWNNSALCRNIRNLQGK